LTRASLLGEAQAELESEREAELFRFAIYSFRRQNNIGQDIVVTLDGPTVKLEKRHVPEVTIS
jgi:hypothetical protein